MVLDLLKANIDKFGLVGQANGDGGDTFQREGMVMVASYLLVKANKIELTEYNQLVERYHHVLDLLEVDECYSFRRHMDETKWYGQPDRMSRDQLVSNIVAMGLVRSPKLKYTAFMHITRFGFTTNIRDNFVGEDAKRKLPDFCGPSILGSYIRAFGFKVLKPLIYLTDIELIVNSILIKRQVKKDPSLVDLNSHLMLLVQSQVSMPTFVSRLAVKILNKMPLCPPPSYTNGNLLSQFGPQTALDLYFDKNQSGGAPLINELYRPTLEEVLCVK